MDSTAILFGILPLLAFVIIDTFFGMKAALVGAVLLSFLEAILSYHYFGYLDLVTGFSILLVIILAITSYKYKKEVFIKFQPALLSFVMGFSLIISYLISKPLLLSMMLKYKTHLPENLHQISTTKHIVDSLTIGTNVFGWALLLHSFVTGWAAIKLSNWWWIAIRGIGFYLIMFLAAIFTNFYIMSG
jgi:intracellular septation protein